MAVLCCGEYDTIANFKEKSSMFYGLQDSMHLGVQGCTSQPVTWCVW